MNDVIRQVSAAIGKNDFPAVKKLIKKNPELMKHLDAKTGAVWLNMSIANNNLNILQYLVDAGCDVNAGGIFGKTPLCAAAEKGNVPLMTWLIDHGAALDTGSRDSNPLLYAITENQVEAAGFLLSRGLDAHAAYPAIAAGENALDLAKYYGHKELISLLGGDPQEKKVHVKTDLPDFTGIKTDEAKVKGIERELHLSLPDYFRSFLLHHFPAALYHEDAPDNDDWQWLGPDYLLFHTARSFIAYNAVNPGAAEKKMHSAEYLVIGTNGGGDDWCIRLDERDRNIHQYLHEEERYKNLDISLPEHVASLIEDA